MNKFEQALRILGIDEKAGPEGAKRAYETIITQHGSTMAPDVRKRVEAAWGLLRRGEVWARAFELQRQQNGLKPPVGPDGAAAPRPRGGSRVTGGTRPSDRVKVATGRSTNAEQPDGGAAAPAASSSALPEDVRTSLTSLAERHADVIDIGRLGVAVSTAKRGGITQYISGLVANGHTQAAGDSLLTVLDIMTSNGEYRWVDSRHFATLTLKMMSANPEEFDQVADLGLRIMRDHQKWKEKREDNRGKTDAATSMRQRWIKDLATVGAELPQGFRELCIQAALEGDANRAKQRAQTWAGRRRGEAGQVRALIEDKAPAIAQVLASELPKGRRGGGEPISLDLSKLSMPTLPKLSLNALNEMSIEEVAEEWERRKKGLAKGLGIFLGLLLVVTIILSIDTEPIPKELVEAQKWVCDYSGPKSKECTYATRIASEIHDGDCMIASRMLPRLESETARAAGGAVTSKETSGASRAQVLQAIGVFKSQYKQWCTGDRLEE